MSSFWSTITRLCYRTRFHVALVLMLISALFGLVGTRHPASAQTSAIPTASAAPTTAAKIQVFVREGCQHCQNEEKFISELQATQPQLVVEYFRLENAQDRQRWQEFTERTGTSKVTPLTIIGSQLIIGFDQPETTGQAIKQALATAQKRNQLTDYTQLTAETLKANQTIQTSTCPDDGSVPCAVPGTRQPVYVSVPFFGQLDVQAYPLAILSIILGFLDGFNPCAMWVLVTFLVILLQVGDRRKMLQFAGTFILAETVMYYAILLVWFKTWDFVQLDAVVTPIIGLIAMGGGVFFLWEWHKEGVECNVTNLDQRSQTRNKIKQLAEQNFTLLTMLGILGIAFSVNVIEFACSIGIPQTFTKILEMNNLNLWQSQFFLLLYILFYMVDDFIVFGLALFCYDQLGLAHKYSKASNLIGGLLMIALGLIMLFKPTWLVF